MIKWKLLRLAKGHMMGHLKIKKTIVSAVHHALLLHKTNASSFRGKQGCQQPALLFFNGSPADQAIKY